MNRLGNATNTNTRLRILQVFVQPKLTYCLPGWGHLTSCTAIDHTLVHADRVVLHNKADELGKPTFFSTGLLPFNELCIQRCVLAVHAIISNDNANAALYVLSLLVQTNSQTVTRNVTGRRFIMPKHKLAASDFAFITVLPGSGTLCQYL